MDRTARDAAHWRSRAMAQAVGASGAVAALGPTEAQRLTEVCGACRFPDRCLLWRLEEGPADEAPGYCLNHTVFGALRAG